MKKILIAFTAGAVLGVLFAPAKGKVTRRKITHLGDGLKESWNDLTDMVACKIDNLRNNIDDLSDKAVEKVESTQFDMGNNVV